MGPNFISPPRISRKDVTHIFFGRSVAPLGVRFVFNEDEGVFLKDYVCSTKHKPSEITAECMLLYLGQRCAERRAQRQVDIVVPDAGSNLKFEDSAPDLCWVHTTCEAHTGSQEGCNVTPEVVDVGLNYRLFDHL